MTKFKLLVWLCLWGAITSAKAQNQLTLKDAIALALQNNYDIKLVKNDLLIAQNNVSIGGSGMLPAISGNFSNSGSRQNSVQTQSTGTERRIDGARNSNLNYGVGLDWTVFDGFKMFATYEKFKVLAQQGQLELKAQVLSSVANVINAYYNLAKQQQLVAAADTAIDISNLRVTIAKNKLQLGKGSKLDLLAAQVDYNADTSSYLQQKNLLANYQTELNRLLAIAANTPTQASEIANIDKSLAFDALAAQTNANNPDLQNALISKKIAELTLKEVRAARLPTVSLNSGYEFNRSATPTGFNTQFRSQGFTYGVTASVNIFNGFLQNRNEKNAKIAINSSEISLERTKQDINAQLAVAYQNYQTNLQLLALEEKNVDIAAQNLDITLAKYRLGNIAPLELREAQRNAIDAKSRFLEVEYQAKVAEASLKQISGTLDIQ